LLIITKVGPTYSWPIRSRLFCNLV